MYAEAAPPADLAGHLRCSWTRVTGGSGTVLPDGCLDLMWVGGALMVAGPDSVVARSEVRPGVEIAAVRFRPGAAPAVLGLPASDLRDRRVPLAELWADGALLERQVSDASDRVAELTDAVRRRLADAPAPDPVALAVAGQLGRRSAGVAGLAAWTGLSERQLHRRCLTAFGYGAKTLDRVLRLQRFLALGRSDPDAGLARLAVEAGYADQPHLTRDCHTLAGTTPARLLR
ncbi:MAG TPA: helix-turn-helix domain-containing protein [Mycobacteriales bacterium]|nr:helix-turn-helix domain-containing protein [Mycobacteriales bacterium]